MNDILITSYENPDLDGYACAYAYAEYLQKMGIHANAGIFGKHDRETTFVLEKFQIKRLPQAEKLTWNKVILVDTSDIHGMSSQIDRRNVIEIIDHRAVHDAEQFPHAKVQIELVGAAATLIAEKIRACSPASAALLYSAIASNTINFKAPNTTERDRAMARSLKGMLHLEPGYVHDMFVYKSRFSGMLRRCFDDIAEFTFGRRKIGIVQLEIIDARSFVIKNVTRIKKELQKLAVDHALFKCIDIEMGENFFVTEDEMMQKALENVVQVRFREGLATSKGIIMRKHLVPMLKTFFEKS